MAVVTHTFIEKSNTLIRECPYNTGLNPIIELNYGKTLTRGLIYFDHSKVEGLISNGTYPDISKFTHKLHMINAGSINSSFIHKPMYDIDGKLNKRRAASFDLVFFLVPYEWDEGKGFDYYREAHGLHEEAVSTFGSNWYQYRSHYAWDNEGCFTTDQLSKELDKFTSSDGGSDVIIGYQHFDNGSEDINIDITEVFNKFINGDIANHGIGIAFSPKYEYIESNREEYVGFFSPHTQSFFAPYVETRYDEVIEDDRLSFHLDKDNKLYLYVSMGETATDLDTLPVCSIDGKEYEVTHATRGVYYVVVNMSSEEYDVNEMHYDTWSDIVIDGKTMSDVEMEFVTLPPQGYLHIGLPSEGQKGTKVLPTLYGIGQEEDVIMGDIRKVNVDIKIPYTSRQLVTVNEASYRIYAQSGDRQIDIIGWTVIERAYNGYFFIMDTMGLKPTRYHVDIRVKNGGELFHYLDILSFNVVNSLNEGLFK